MAQIQPYQRLSPLLFLLCFCCSVYCQSGLNTSAHYSNLSQAFPQLDSLYTSPYHPRVGNRNSTRCCLQAVSESYVMQDGQPIQNPNRAQDYINFPPLNLSQSQFPCGASYNGDKSGAQAVVVPYSWCKKNCDGWEKSTSTALSQWVQPFVGFILPAAVFCLNVPRKSMIGIWDGFFKDHFDELPGAMTDVLVELAFVLHFLLTIFFKKRKLERLRNWIERETREGGSSKHGVIRLVVRLFTLLMVVNKTFLLMLFRATFAAGIALVNTLIWVAVVFSAAGPMILSGLYEASLDRKVIRSILQELKTEEKKAKKEENGDLPRVPRDRNAEREVFYKRIHQLYAILVGNLQLPEQGDIKDEPETPRSVWKDVYHLVNPPRQGWAIGDGSNEKDRSRTDDSIEPATSGDIDAKADKQMLLNSVYRKITETRLKGMLDCQASFRAAVGAPVVFFVGSFLFGVISNLSSVGDNDTSHALAFGMWWMTIPHVAIVAGCLLAGNNPNTLEIIVSSQKGGPWEGKDMKARQGFRKFYLFYYQSVYIPVEMWARGKNKKIWIDELFFRYGASPTSKDAEGRGKHVARHGKGEFHFDLWDWIWMVNITVGLMVLPFVLAFLTAYYTPTVGIACRTLTFLLYFVFQLCLGMIWLFDFFNPFVWTKHVDWLPFGTYIENGSIDEKGKDNEPAKDREMPDAEVIEYITKPRNNTLTVMGFLLGFFFTGSLFTTVMGTFFQILGVYRNCLCMIPVAYWTKGDYLLDISTNTAEAIRLATKFWLPTGVASIVLMIITCYIGWWYQRHWRHQFNAAVKALLEPKDGSIHDPKADYGMGSSPKPVSQNRIPRKSVPGASIEKDGGSHEEIMAIPPASQGQNDHVMSKREHIFFDDPGDG